MPVTNQAAVRGGRAPAVARPEFRQGRCGTCGDGLAYTAALPSVRCPSCDGRNTTPADLDRLPVIPFDVVELSERDMRRLMRVAQELDLEAAPLFEEGFTLAAHERPGAALPPEYVALVTDLTQSLAEQGYMDGTTRDQVHEVLFSGAFARAADGLMPYSVPKLQTVGIGGSAFLIAQNGPDPRVLLQVDGDAGDEKEGEGEGEDDDADDDASQGGGQHAGTPAKKAVDWTDFAVEIFLGIFALATGVKLKVGNEKFKKLVDFVAGLFKRRAFLNRLKKLLRALNDKTADKVEKILKAIKDLLKWLWDEFSRKFIDLAKDLVGWWEAMWGLGSWVLAFLTGGTSKVGQILVLVAELGIKVAKWAT